MKNYFKLLGLVVIGIVFLGSNIAQGETLQDAVKYMLESNPDIKAIAYNRLAKDQEVTQAKAGFYPSIDFAASYGLQHDIYPTRVNTWPTEYILGLRQNLFAGGTTMSEVDRQKARVNSQAYLLQGTTENITLQAAKAYSNVLRRTELYCLAKENLVNHERIYDQMKMRSESGAGAAADLDQVKGRLALAESNLIVAKANLVDARTDYIAVVGRMPEDLAEIPSMESAVPASMGEVVDLALKGYPIYKSAQADLEAREAQYRTAKNTLYPKVDAAVDYKWMDNVDYNPNWREQLLATIMLRFNLFKGFSDKARITETKHLASEASEIMDSTRRQIVQSIRLAWEAYTASSGKVIKLEDYVKSAEMTAEAFAKQWNLGRRTMFDLLDTQAELINAKIDLVNSKYDKTDASYRVVAGMGKLANTLGLEWAEEAKVATE
ncbi:MAG: TolC family outer membrane protein [Pseudomonadota bacterium]